MKVWRVGEIGREMRRREGEGWVRRVIGK